MNPADPFTSSSAARRGKIARLPAGLRRELNLRLENNEPADSILPWLNGLDETKTILAAQFAGAEITPQNLSEWRQGGFHEWILLQELMDHAARLHEGIQDLSSPCDPPALADNLAAVLAARYAALLNSWNGEITPEFEAKINFLRGLARDVTQLQKSLHRAARQTHDLARQQKEDAAQDLAEIKKTAISKLDADRRRRFSASNRRSYEAATAIVAVEDASSEPEVLAVCHQFGVDSIQLDPIKNIPSPPSKADSMPENQAAA